MDQPWKLWIYTNYDCNQRCSYCVVRSSPGAPRQAIGAGNALRLVDEAVELGFGEVYLTGGEPFLLEEIFDILEYASARIRTCVLTNALLLKGARLDRLAAVAGDSLTLQVSLDGACPAQHDAYRGAGTWVKTVAGIRRLQERGLRLRLSTTLTPANCDQLEDLCAFHRSLGIAEEDHVVRPLARRGRSQAGVELGKGDLAPEITVNHEGVFWHPLATDPDLLVSREIFPLKDAVQKIAAYLTQQLEPVHSSQVPSKHYT